MSEVFISIFESFFAIPFFEKVNKLSFVGTEVAFEDTKTTLFILTPLSFIGYARRSHPEPKTILFSFGPVPFVDFSIPPDKLPLAFPLAVEILALEDALKIDFCSLDPETT